MTSQILPNDADRTRADASIVGSANRIEYENHLMGEILRRTHQSLWDMLLESVDRHPKRPAVSMGDVTWSFEELLARALRVARRLQEMSVGKGSRVAFFFHACPEWAALHYALARLGAVAVPINLAFEAKEIRHVLSSVEPEMIITVDRFRGVDLAEKLRAADPGFVEGPADVAAFPSVRRVVLLPLDPSEHVATNTAGARMIFGDTGDQSALTDVRSEAFAYDPAYIIFTSGSTAMPKPASCSHASFLGSATGYAHALAMTPDDRFLAMLPTFHTGGVTCVLTAPHLAGACTDLIGGFSAPAALDCVERSGCTATVGFDVMYTKMLEVPSFRLEKVASLTRAVVAATPSFIQRLLEAWPLELIATTYGSTESGALATIVPTWTHDVAKRHETNGTVLPGIDMVIVDPETGGRCPPGVPGEIAFRGWCRVLEYAGMPDETRATIDEHGYFHSGDCGVFDEEGFLYFQGRYKTMIKTGGENVAEREVEVFLEQELPVDFAQVVGIPDPVWGEVVVAFVQLSPGGHVDQLREAASGKIAKYKIPSHFIQLAAEEFPVIANGRPDKTTLRRMAVDRLEPTPQPGAHPSEPAFGSSPDGTEPDAPVQLRLDMSDSFDANRLSRRERSWDQLGTDLRSFTTELYASLSELGPARADAMSLCSEWTIRDVVLHLMVGDDLAERALRGENCFPDPTDDETFLQDLGKSKVAAFADASFAEAMNLFERHREKLLDTMASMTQDDLAAKVPWAAGQISRFAVAQARFMETWIHSWDIRMPLSMPQPLDDRAWWVSDIAVRTLPYSFMKQGHAVPVGRVTVDLAGPGGGHWDRTLSGESYETMAVSGPTWAWLHVTSRRDVLPRFDQNILAVQPSTVAPRLFETARAFA